MRYLSVCSGVEAASLAWAPLGWTPVAFSEVAPFPSAVLAHRFGSNHPGETPADNGVPNLGDMTRFSEWPNYAIDLLVGGTPCFPGDTLIACRRGLVPICDVAVGDLVLTHAGRWQKVLAIGSKRSPTMRLIGQGNSTGIVTTADHPFYARRKSRRWVGREAGSYRSEMSGPDWVRAEDMRGLFWASPSAWPGEESPAFDALGRESTPPLMSEALAWVVGRWLGDGWTRIGKRRGYALICCGKHEADDLARRLSDAGLRFSKSQERTTMRFQIANRAFARWLLDNFGAGAAGKTVPTWAFGWRYRKALLHGYISADGCRTKNGWRISTVSRGLALGSVLLAHSLGMSASRRLVTTGRASPAIEGRAVSERPFWQITIYESARSSVDIDGHRWGLVRKVEPYGESEVFNIEVEGDNSYVADGVVVHNCQSFSVAGLRAGLADPRGNLALVYLAIADRYRPEWICWENVPGVLSSNSGRDFGAFLGGLGQLGYGWAYRVLDAQYVRVDGFGRAVPQRRRRVVVVGHSGGDARCAAAVLFDAASLRGDSAPRREARKSTASAFGGGPDGGLIAGNVSAKWAKGTGGPAGDEAYNLVAHDVAASLTRGAESAGEGGYAGHRREDDVNLVAHTLRGEGFDASEDGSGRGTPLVPIAFAFDTTQITSPGNFSRPKLGDPCRPLAATAHPPALAFDLRGREGGALFEGPHDAANIRAASGGSSRSYVATNWAVRRLTPVECERLMGFPDGWTDVPYRGKPAADGPRYQAIGNSMAVNMMRWIGRRIAMVDALTKAEAA